MKTPFWSCFWYLIATGAISFLIGRIIPKGWFRADAFPYRAYDFEKNGKLYESLNIRHWQNRLPDMSRILPGWMPAKNMAGDYKARLPQMLQETCVAELIHTLLCISGLYCLKLWPGAGGVLTVILYITFFNLPYILIQRYNRPRLLRLAQKLAGLQSAQRSMESA